jgi:curved DNA-binding protein CbpA
MTDNFALLNEPRRPWLDAEVLKVKFLALASELHPDRFHNAGEAEKTAATKRYAELSAAYNCLLEPKSRLLHLLELESGAKPKDIQQIPPALADLFAEVANGCRDADHFLVEKSRVTSPLLQVQWFERAHERIGQLNQLQKKLGVLHEQLIGELQAADAKWETAAHPELFAQLEELYRLFSYFNRWHSQLQERITRLSF